MYIEDVQLNSKKLIKGMLHVPSLALGWIWM